MVGSAIVRRLQSEPVDAILSANRSELDLTRQSDVENWMEQQRPDIVVIAAAKVGGILANESYPADFLYENLAIQTSLIKAAASAGVKKLLFLGSSCIYPKFAEQPISEESLLTGPLEPTNQWYAIAKIAGIMLCDAFRAQHGLDFISAMPTNLYGPGDNYNLDTSHVIPALIRKTLLAKRNGERNLMVWGSGNPRREFLHADDMADAAVFLLRHFSAAGPINVGCGKDIRISELASLIADICEFDGEIVYDTSKPDGTPRKLLDVSRLNELGWFPSIGLRHGLSETISDLPNNFLSN